jgi:hypothetical protein
LQEKIKNIEAENNAYGSESENEASIVVDESSVH